MAQGGRIVDLGCGSGSLPRHLAPRLSVPCDWLLVDAAQPLLDEATRRCRELPGVAALTTLRADLAADLSFIGERPTALVTASALLDLVSDAWLARLIDACAAAHVPLMAMLTYDGLIEIDPALPDDAPIIALFNEHQRGDKGFGPALGPAAAARAAERFGAAGYRLETARSDWTLGVDDAALIGPLLDGWAAAASEIAPAESARFARWLTRRREQLAAGRLSVRVGHEDLLALPRRTPA
ncbi:MAG: class I SAM-dependent methyltransferase [Burkholderiaceae bacterium]